MKKECSDKMANLSNRAARFRQKLIRPFQGGSTFLLFSCCYVLTYLTSVLAAELVFSNYQFGDLRLSFLPPRNDGGEEVSKYKIEWDASDNKAAVPSFDPSSQYYGTAEVSHVHEEQDIIVSCLSACTGTFAVSWGGRTADTPLRVDATSSEVEDVIGNLIGAFAIDNAAASTSPIRVSRKANGFAYKWRVSFLGLRGDVGLIEADGDLLSGGGATVRTYEVKPGASDLYPGAYTNEIQTVTVRKRPGFGCEFLAGSFGLLFEGEETIPIEVDATSFEFKEALESLSTIHTVDVRTDHHSSIGFGDCAAQSWVVTFTHLVHENRPGAGNIGMLQPTTLLLADPTVTTVSVFENVKGTNPRAFSIRGLTYGLEYHCRVSAYNAVGYGFSSSTVTATPITQPRPPRTVILSVPSEESDPENAGTSIIASWEAGDDYDGGDAVTGYKLEWFTSRGNMEVQKVTTSSSDGTTEVQAIKISADKDGITGFFTLTFNGETTDLIAHDANADGNDSVEMKLERLSTVGDIEVTRGLSWTSVPNVKFDLSSGSPILTRVGGSYSGDLLYMFSVGDVILVGSEVNNVASVESTALYLDQTYTGPSANAVHVHKWTYGYEWLVTFSSHIGKQPLLEASPANNWAGTNAIIGTNRVREGLQPLSGSFTLSFEGERTLPIPFDAEAGLLKDALESLKSIGEVAVSRFNNNNGYNYFITFISELGDREQIIVDDSMLIGPNAQARAGTLVDGGEHSNYGYALLPHVPSTGMSTMKYQILGLRNGLPYFVRIRCKNSKGFGYSTIATPFPMKPVKAPLPPSSVTMFPLSDSRIRIKWQAPAHDGGSEIIKYSVQWDTNNVFSSAWQEGFHYEVMADVDNIEREYCHTFSVESLSLGTPRYARVLAFNGHEWSTPLTSSPSFTVGTVGKPGPVTNLNAFMTSGIGILVTWSHPKINDAESCGYSGDGGSPISHYVIEYSRTSDFSPTASSVIASSTSTEKRIGGRDVASGSESSDLEQGEIYFVRMMAFNSMGQGFMETFPFPIGPLVDVLPSSPIMMGATPESANSIQVEWDTPAFDGGDAIREYVLEYGTDPDFSTSSTLSVPIVNEVQAFEVSSKESGNSIHAIQAVVLVRNEVQSVRTEIDGVDEVQEISTTCDDVTAEVQTIVTTAVDTDEEQTVSLISDDIDEIQLLRIQGDDQIEVQTVQVSVPRVNEVQKFGIVISNINTDGDGFHSTACIGIDVGNPCPDVENALAGSFTVSFDFDECGTGIDGSANYCQLAFAKYEMGTVVCSPGLVSNPSLGGDHCVSKPVTQYHSSLEGDVGTLQYVINNLVDDNGVLFMTSSNGPGKQTGVSVTREGRIKTKGSCTLDPVGTNPATCSGEYELFYEITFDAPHVSGDVPPITVADSDFRLDETSTSYTTILCPSIFFVHGCVAPIGAALDSSHGSFYDGDVGSKGFEAVKGSQPIGTISLDYECESEVNILPEGYLMTVSGDGMSAVFDYLGFVAKAVVNHWVRFSAGDGIDHYRKISGIDITTESVTFVSRAPVNGATYADVEYGTYFSDWDESDDDSGVSNHCKASRIQSTLPIDVDVFNNVVSETDWKGKIGALQVIDSPGITVSRSLVADLSTDVGLIWDVTFQKQPGNVHEMSCNVLSGDSECTVSTLQDSSMINGVFKLQTTWPHEYVSEAIHLYETGYLQWNIGEDALKQGLESVKDANGDRVFGLVQVSRSPYLPPSHSRWCGGYLWTITYLSRGGNIPALGFDGSGLFGHNPILEVSDEDSGVNDLFQGVRNSAVFNYDDPGLARDGNQIAGSFSFSWAGNSYHSSVLTGSVFTVQNGGSSTDRYTALSAERFKALFEEFVLLGSNNQVDVVRSNQPTQWIGYSYTIKFRHQDVGGDVPPLNFLFGSSLFGQNSHVQIEERVKGTEIFGTFQLRFEGETTRPINHDASAQDIQDALNELNSIAPSIVIVTGGDEPTRSGPPDGIEGLSTQVCGRVWYVTFASNVWKDPTSIHDASFVPGNWVGPPASYSDTWSSGFSKAWGKNVGDVPLITCVQSGLSTTNGDIPDYGCSVKELVAGTNPLSGRFKLCLDTFINPNGVMSVETDACTDFIAHNAVASANESGGDGSSVEEKLEELPNVGDVSVVRSGVNPRNGGYTWKIQFLTDADGPCQQKDDVHSLCNAPGDVPKICNASGSSTCDTNSLQGTCLKPGACSKLTVLDASNFSNGHHVPGGNEKQVVYVKDTSYLGWEDGSVVDKKTIFKEYKLLVNGIETQCIKHNALASEMASSIQTALDSGIGGNVRVDRTQSEYLAQNGFLYHLTFYDTGNLDTIQASFSDGACTHDFEFDQSVVVIPVSDGNLHQSNCEDCKDGVVQRGEIETFEVPGDSLGGSLTWNAKASDVKMHLEQIYERTVAVTRNVLDKYGTIEWVITFTQNAGVVPPGSGDVQEMSVSQGRDTLGRLARVLVNERIKGSVGLSGTFDLDYLASGGSRTFAFDESAARMSRKLEEMSTIGRVRVTRDCYPSCSSGGWGGIAVGPETFGGFQWIIHFLKNPGSDNGFAFPYGSGVVNLPAVDFTRLVGDGAAVTTTRLSEGSLPLNGAFRLQLHGEVTSFIPYNVDSQALKNTIEDLDIMGEVTVKSGMQAKHLVQGVYASVETDSASATLSGDDLRNQIAPGDFFAIGGSIDEIDGANRVGTVSLSPLSPVLSDVSLVGRNHLFVGESVRIAGETYSIVKTGVEIQQLAVHRMNGIADADFYQLKVTFDGALEVTKCLRFDSSAVEVATALNDLSVLSDNGGVLVSGIENSSGYAGDAHLLKIYFIGEGLVGDIEQMTAEKCSDGVPAGVDSTNSHIHVRSLSQGGKIEHQRITLASDYGSTSNIPAFSLSISDSESNTWDSPCFAWGVQSLDISSKIDPFSFSRAILLVGGSGPVDLGNNKYELHANNFVEGFLVVGDLVNPGKKCSGSVLSIGPDGKSFVVDAAAGCSAVVGDGIFVGGDVSVIDTFIDNGKSISELSELIVFSDAQVISEGGLYKIRVDFKGSSKSTSCLPFDSSAEKVQHAIGSLFDFNNDGVIDYLDEEHISVTRKGDGTLDWGYGYSYEIMSNGSNGSIGPSAVLGSSAPKISIVDIGADAGCVDAGVEGPLISSIATTTDESNVLLLGPDFSGKLNAGDRIRARSSLAPSKVYTVDHIDHDGSVILTEDFSGETTIESAVIYAIVGGSPRFTTSIIRHGVDEFVYDIFFVGSHWKNVPQIEVNSFGDGTCIASNADIVNGMNRKIDVTTLVDGGGSIVSEFDDRYVVDRPTSLSHGGSYSLFVIPPIFSIKDDSSEVQRILVMDSGNDSVWSSGNPSYKLSFGGEFTNCLPRDSSERLLEDELNSLVSLCPGTDPCVTVTRRDDPALAPNGFVYMVYFDSSTTARHDIADPGFGGLEADVSHLDCHPFDDVGGERVWVETIKQGRESLEFGSNKVPFGPYPLGRWVGEHQENLPIYKVSGFYWFVQYGQSLGNVPGLTFIPDEVLSETSYSAVDEIVRGRNPNRVTVGGLQTGITHFFRAYSRSGVGFSAPSNPVSEIPSAKPEKITTLLTGYAIHQNEVQNLVLAASHQKEVQSIQTSAMPIPEVQEISLAKNGINDISGYYFSLRRPEIQIVKWSAGSPVISGSYFLKLLFVDRVNSDLSGKVIYKEMKTPCISFDATANDIKRAMETDSLSNGLGEDAVRVIRSGNRSYSSDYGYSYEIHFVGPSLRGNILQLTSDKYLTGLDSNGGFTCDKFVSSTNDELLEIWTGNSSPAIGTDTPRAEIIINSNKDIVDGEFQISVTYFGKQVTTECIPWDASGEQVRSALENLDNIDSVHIYRAGNGHQSFENKSHVQLHEHWFQFLGGNSFLAIPTDNLSSVLFVGDMIQFSDQSDFSEFYEVTNIAGGSIEINKAFDAELFSNHVVTRFFGYRHMIYFNGNAMHTDGTDGTGFKPQQGSNFIVSETGNCRPLRAYEKNVLKQISDIPGAIASIRAVSKYDGGHTLPVAPSYSSSMFVSKSLLSALPMSITEAHVTQSLETTENELTFTITYGENDGDVPSLVCNQSLEQAMMCTAKTVMDGNEIRGNFYINSSGPIPHDASHSLLEAAIEGINGFGDVQVSRSDADGQNGFIWLVTFVEYHGDVEPLKASSSLTGKAATITVDEVTKGNELGGHFSLSYGSETTSLIPYNTNAENLQTCLENLDAIGRVDVYMDPYTDAESGRTFSITFIDPDVGDVPLLVVDKMHLKGLGASISISEGIKGNKSSRDAISVSFDFPRGCSYSHVENSVCGSPIVEVDVEVSTSEDFIGRPNSYQYRPDFSTQIIRTFCSGIAITCHLTGYFNIEYGGDLTTPISSHASEIDVRLALERLRGINTVGVTKKYNFRASSGICIDIVAGSYLVTCSPSCSPCDFGSKGITAGTIIELESKHFRVSSTYDAVQEAFDLATVADSSVNEAYIGDKDLVEWDLLVWTGGYEWVVALHSTIESAVLMTTPKHHLLPANGAVEISTRDCYKCMYLRPLDPGVQYYIRARTKNGRGWSEYSDVVSHIPMGIPSAPTNVRLNAISGECLEVVFDPPAYGDPFESYVIQWDYNDTFDSAEGISASCSSNRYGNCILSQFLGPPPYTYEICNLLRSESYYVRVAARNAVRTQPVYPDGNPKDNTNWSASVSKMTNDQVPDPPTAFDVKVLGPTGAQILFDWPQRNGGSQISKFLVLYDTSEDFSSAIKHFFESTHPKMMPKSGGKFIFDFAPTDPPLIPGMKYFIKMSAISAVGTGTFSTVKTCTPSGPSDPPAIASLSTLQFSKSPITEATVSWSPPASTGGDPVDGYVVEWWSSGKSPEVQAVRLLYKSPLSATTFTLSFSPNPAMKKETSNLPWNASPDLVRRELLNLGWDESGDSLLLSDLKVVRSTLSNGYLWTVTFGDNPDRQLNDGDQVSLVGSVVSNGDLGFPSITVSTIRDGQRPQGLNEIQYLQVLGTGTLSGFYRVKFLGSEWTNYIPVHASAAYVKQALEQLTTIGEVRIVQNDAVDQTFTGTGPNVVHHFEVHFVSNPGNVESLIVDSYHVSSSNDDATVIVFDGNNGLDAFNTKDTAAVPGELPLHYGKSELLDSSSRTYQISGLVTGSEYFVAVSARNSKHGVSKRARTSPPSIIPPVQEPGTPRNVWLDVNSGYSDSLVAHFDPPESTGGDKILLYRVELDPSPTFDNPIVQDFECPPSNRRTEWEIKTYVEGGGILNGGSFRLELEVDGFISVTSDIPYDAVALSSNETGVSQYLAITFSTLSGSDVLSTIPQTNIENVVFPGDRLRFSGQTKIVEYYEVISVSSTSAILNRPFDGNGGAQASTTRHYGGRGSPLSSRVHCNFNEDLCPKSSEKRSGSMQSKIEDLSLAVHKGVLVDRDGPNPDNGFIWRVTFLDDAYVDGSNVLLRLHTNSLTTFGSQGTPRVSTSLMTVGKTFSSCFGSVVVPSLGGLLKGLEYYGRVSARNSKGYSLPLQAAIPLAPMVIPGAPTGVTLDVVSATELRLIFGSPADNGGDSITQYLIEWSTTQDFMNVESTTLDYLVGGSPFFKTISGLRTGVYYFVRVSAKNSQGYGISQVATPSSLNPHQRPSPPTNVKLGITSSTMLTIGWDVPMSDGGDSISKYRIEWDTRQGFSSSSHPPNKGYIDVDASFRSHTLELLSSEKSYFLRIHALNSAGYSAPQLTYPDRAVPSLQVPGVPYLVVASSGTAIGTVEISWQRPTVPHHAIPCFEEDGIIINCPTPYGGSIPASDGGDDIIEYEVEINNRPDFLGGDGLRKTYVGFHAVINNLYSQRSYFVRVLARNSIGSGKYSNAVQVTAA